MYFNQAQNYRTGRRRKIRLIVIHTAETPETSTSAEGIINYFASANSPMASTHYAVDNNSVAQGVRDSDTAFAAPGANADGLQVEHAGRAGQGKTGWDDPYSQAMLEISARFIAEKCAEYGIPAKHVTGSELANGTGICGHADVNAVYKQSDHWDPGPDFPWEHYINRVNHYLGNTAGVEVSNNQENYEGESMFIVKTVTPWGAEVYALIGETTGARALDANEAQAYGALCGRVAQTPWDYWNLLVRQAWERRNEFLKAMGQETGTSVDDAVQRVIDAIKENKQ